MTNAMLGPWCSPQAPTGQKLLRLLQQKPSIRCRGRHRLMLSLPAASASLAASLAAATPPCDHSAAILVPQLVSHPVLAAVVPEFPRIGGQVVRDWIGAAVEQLPGIDGNDIARLLLPDLVGLVDGPTLLITITLLLALVYWEGGILLRQLRQRQAQQRQQAQQQRRQQRRHSSALFGSWDPGAGEDSESEEEEESGQAGRGGESGAADGMLEDWGPAPAQKHASYEQRRAARIERARYQRRRGLGWLALVTSGCIWMTGVVSGPSPFQP